MQYNRKLIFLLLGLLMLLNAGCFREALEGNRMSRDIRISNPYRGSVSMSFELINNLIVVPMRINNSDTLKFVLDTGAGRTVITELGPNQSFDIIYDKEILLRGLGNSGPIPALISSDNLIYLKGIEGENQDLVILLEDVFKLSNFMGTQVNGLIGYDIFENFIVEIDYYKKRLFFHDPDYFQSEYVHLSNHEDWEKVSLDIDNNKLYLQAFIMQSNDEEVEVKLVVDTGASHTLFLYQATNENIFKPEASVTSYLGTGLSGIINGEIGRAKSVKLGRFTLPNPVISFPDSADIHEVLKEGDRNGSIGADFFRRFRTIINYKDSTLILKPNRYFNSPFKYNVSGMEISTPFQNLPYYVVSIVRPESPAEEAGIKVGDVIYEVGYTRVYDISLNELIDLLHTPDEKIRLIIKRGEDFQRINLDLVDKTKIN